MSLLDDEQTAADELDKIEEGFPCEECGKTFATKHRLGLHRRTAHGIASPRADHNRQSEQRRKTRKRTATSTKGLQDSLRGSHNALAILAVAGSNPAALADKRVVDAIEERGEHWAAALTAVCEQDARVLAIVSAAMGAGVWIAFLTATAGSVCTVAVASGRAAIPYGVVKLVAPEMASVLEQVTAEQMAAQSAAAQMAAQEAAKNGEAA